MDRALLEEACRALPLFPLPGTVLMLGSLLPLHVFEPRYRRLVADCLRDQLPLAVCQIRPSEVDDAARSPGLLPYAGVGIVGAHVELPDGRFNVLVQPVGRVRLLSDRPTEAGYRVAHAELLWDLPASDADLGAAGERVRGLFAPLIVRMGPVGEGVARALRSLPSDRVPEAVAAVVLRSVEARQLFLAEDDPFRRAARVEEAVLTLIAEFSGASMAEA